MNRRTRLTVTSFLFTTVLLGMPVLLTWRGVRQVRLDRALIFAVKQRRADAVVSLLKDGANPNAREYSGRTISVWQAFWNLFLRFRQRNKTARQEGNTALILAANEYYIRRESARGEPFTPFASIPVDPAPSIVHALLDAGANPNCRDAVNGTPLIYAAQYCPTEVRHLLDKGADVNAQDDAGWTALMFANTPSLDRMLVERGADVNAVSKFGRTPLMQATLQNRGCVRFLLDKGAHINHQDSEGVNTLMLAALGGDVEMVRILLARHADVTINNGRGGTVLLFADNSANKYRTQIIRMLKQAGAQSSHYIDKP